MSVAVLKLSDANGRSNQVVSWKLLTFDDRTLTEKEFKELYDFVRMLSLPIYLCAHNCKEKEYTRCWSPISYNIHSVNELVRIKNILITCFYQLYINNYDNIQYQKMWSIKIDSSLLLKSSTEIHSQGEKIIYNFWLLKNQFIYFYKWMRGVKLPWHLNYTGYVKSDVTVFF